MKRHYALSRTAPTTFPKPFAIAFKPERDFLRFTTGGVLGLVDEALGRGGSGGLFSGSSLRSFSGFWHHSR
jgi:hypothetical protein